MSQHALPPARSRRRSHRADLSRCAILITLVSALLLLAACAGVSTASPNSSNPLAVVVTVSPATPSVVSAGTIQFSAVVTNTSNTAVTWSASPGSISSAGLYQAPTVTVTTNATVTATSVADTTKSGTASVTITAGSSSPGPLSITTKSLPGATAGTAYASPLSAAGGKAPYSWSLASGTLPTGVTVNSAGSLSGTTTQTGQFAFTVQVTDSSSPQQTATQSLTLTVSTSTGSGNIPPATYFGFSWNDTDSLTWPTVSYGMQRFWDSPGTQWPDINTASGVFDFTLLDSDLALAYSKGTMDGLYTLSRTPPWATSNPNDTSCSDTTGQGGGNGECDPPIDLNSDGSGTNAIWKAWITAIATHVNSSGYTATHAHIKYWEIWNEPDTKNFWVGSIAQLARLTEDANCIITGRGVIHESGNGTATACTATPIDPTAQIVMASAHAKGAALNYGQNELYCNNSPSGDQLPCPNPPNAIATAVDIINFHMKPGNESGNNCPAPTPCTPESAMQWYISNIHGILQPAELAKPLWDGEAQYSSTGFINAYADPDMAASFMPRFYLLNWTFGLNGMAWYYASSANEPVEAQTSYQQTYNWLVNATLVTPCAAVGTVWSCTISSAGTQRSLHHGEPDSIVAMDAIPEHDDRRHSHHDLRRRSSSRDQASRAELASPETKQTNAPVILKARVLCGPKDLCIRWPRRKRRRLWRRQQLAQVLRWESLAFAKDSAASG
jgi:Putative Ig domain